MKSKFRLNTTFNLFFIILIINLWGIKSINAASQISENSVVYNKTTTKQKECKPSFLLKKRKEKKFPFLVILTLLTLIPLILIALKLAPILTIIIAISELLLCFFYIKGVRNGKNPDKMMLLFPMIVNLIFIGLGAAIISASKN